MAGLDLTKHDKLESCIEEFKNWSPKSPKFVGVRHLVGNQPFDFLTREDVQAGLGILEKHDVPFDLYVVPGSLCHVATIAEKFPKLRLIIDHIGKPKVQDGEIEEWKKDISAAAKFPNVFVKLSGMIIEAKPLHKKKKRLLRQQTLLTERPSGDRLSSILEVPSSNPIGLLVGGRT